MRLHLRPCFCICVRASARPSSRLRVRPCFCVSVRPSVSVRAFACLVMWAVRLRIRYKYKNYVTVHAIGKIDFEIWALMARTAILVFSRIRCGYHSRTLLPTLDSREKLASATAALQTPPCLFPYASARATIHGEIYDKIYGCFRANFVFSCSFRALHPPRCLLQTTSLFAGKRQSAEVAIVRVLTYLGVCTLLFVPYKLRGAFHGSTCTKSIRHSAR